MSGVGGQYYPCPKKLCAFYVECPYHLEMSVVRESEPDENGQFLFYAVCDEMGTTICGLNELDLKERCTLKDGADGTMPSGAEAIRAAAKGPSAEKTSTRHKRNGGVRATNGELTQEDVAKDFGVRRQTIVKWEDEQTEDGPNNTSNPYHYYRALRLDSNLRGAYMCLVKSAKLYLKTKKDAKKGGDRFRVTFERFNEEFKKHNEKR